VEKAKDENGEPSINGKAQQAFESTEVLERLINDL
jgi:hypothetical protein